MARRVEGDLKLRCNRPGCRTETFRSYVSQEQLRAAQEARDIWLCWDHDGSRVRLTPGTPAASSVLVLSERVSESVPNGRYVTLAGRGLYFGPPGGEATQGRVSGEGWYALAKDFPAGTRLEMTVRMVLSEATGTAQPVPVEKMAGSAENLAELARLLSGWRCCGAPNLCGAMCQGDEVSAVLAQAARVVENQVERARREDCGDG